MVDWGDKPREATEVISCTIYLMPCQWLNIKHIEECDLGQKSKETIIH